jgi:hypothetical protein
VYSLRTSGAFSSPSTSEFVRIASSRSRIEPREPTVGFTIVTDRPFAEVFVATSPELFLPENASKRTTSTWFASRAHGLLHGPGDLAYVLPAAFVASAVKAEPRPNKLYFLAAAYRSAESAGDAVWSTPPDAWTSSAPYVEIASELQATAIASTLGIALERLSRAVVAEDRMIETGPFSSLGLSIAAAAPSPENEKVVWRHEATGTLGVPRVVRAFEESAKGDVHESEEDWHDEPSEEPAPSAAAHGYEHDDVDYDDGYGPMAASLDSSYPAGAPEPEDLPDTDEGGGYGDEAASWQASENASPDGAFEVVLDALAAKTKNGTLYAVARATPEDGLAFGLLQATQRSGELGALLGELAQTDRGAFDRIFEGEGAELLDVTRAATPEARMQRVGGKALVDEIWIRRFQTAGAEPNFVKAQRSYARARMLEPLLPLARDLGIATTRGLAMVSCILIARGLVEGMRWILEGISPVTTPAQLERVLPALDVPSLAAFQRREGLRESGELDVRTKARLTRKLRELGSRAPVPVLVPSQMLEALVRQAGRDICSTKLQELHQSATLDDRDL